MRRLEAFVPRQIAFEAHCQGGNAKSRTDKLFDHLVDAGKESFGNSKLKRAGGCTYHVVEAIRCAPQQIEVVDFRLGSMLLKKSFRGYEQIFTEALVR
jgi:hypothetical protein